MPRQRGSRLPALAGLVLCALCSAAVGQAAAQSYTYDGEQQQSCVWLAGGRGGEVMQTGEGQACARQPSAAASAAMRAAPVHACLCKRLALAAAAPHRRRQPASPHTLWPPPLPCPLAVRPLRAAAHAAKVTILSALQLNIRDPNCNRFHQHEEYLYISPLNPANSTRRRALRADAGGFDDPFSNDANGLIEVARGSGLSDKYGVFTGDTASVTLDAPLIEDTGAGGLGSVRRHHSRRLHQGSTSPQLISLDVKVRNSGKEIYSGTPLRFRSITYLISMCGWSPSMTREVRVLKGGAWFWGGGHATSCLHARPALCT